MNAYSWVPEIFNHQVKKLMAYRLEFWVQLLAPLLVQLGVSYFLWRAVFEARGVSEINGYDLPNLMMYYFFATMGVRIVTGGEWRELLAQEIYDGSLSRYLVYPISIFGLKAVREWASMLFNSLQLLVALAVYLFIFGMPSQIHLNVGSIAAGLLACFLAAQISFLMACLVDMMAFWAENVWSLQVILKFALNFLGGALIPLSFFPQPYFKFLLYNPFACMVYFPVQSFLGRLSLLEWMGYFAVTSFWFAVMSTLTWWMWRRGLKEYAGTGM